MYALTAITLLGAFACAQAGLLGYGGVVGPVAGGAIIAGPSGVVSRPGYGAHGAYLGGPGLIGPGAVLGGPALGLGLGLGYGLGHGNLLGLQGSGIEGQYIPDYTEKLYDDGSYKPYIYGH